MYRRTAVTLTAFVLSALAFGQPAYQAGSVSNLNNADTLVYYKNTSASNVCANTYVVDSIQTLVACGSTLLQPGKVYSNSSRYDLISNTFLGQNPTSISVKLLVSTPFIGGCTMRATTVIGSDLVSGTLASISAPPGLSGGTPFDQPVLTTDLTTLPAACLNIINTGNSYGIIRTARLAAFWVDTTADTTDVNPGDEICADSTGHCSLRAAIMESNALSGARTIVLPSGTYLLSIIGAGEDLGATGDLDITRNVTINGAAAATTIIDGGGIDRVFDVGIGGVAVINSVTIRNGDADATGVDGGGIYNKGTLTISNSIVTNNAGRGGGGIANSSGSVTINKSTVTNSSAYYYGSGVWTDGGSLKITDSTVSGNSGRGYRNGAVVSTGGTSTLTNTTISGNTSQGQGAGGFLNWAGTLTMVNSTVSGNIGNGYGGGVVNIYSGTALLVNDTVVGNNDIQVTPAPAGGIYADSGSVSLKNTIVAKNTVGGVTPADCLNSVPMTSLGNNIAGDNTCNLLGVGDRNNTNPLLASLANNGGPTMTHALLSGSSAYDAVPLASCTGPTGTALTTDQRGSVRPQGAACDAGSFEASALVSVTIASAPTSRSFSVTGAGCQPGSYTAPQTLAWSLGASCAVNYASPQSDATGVQFAFTGWADGGIATNPRTIATLAAATTFTANFKTQYQLTTLVSPAGAGSATGAGFYDSGSLAPIVATPNVGYQFVNWTGSGIVTPASGSTGIQMITPASVTANFAVITTTTVAAAAGKIGDTVPLSATIFPTGATFTGNLEFSVGGAFVASISVSGSGTYATNYVITNATGQYPINVMLVSTSSAAIGSSGSNTLTVSVPVTFGSLPQGRTFTVAGAGCALGSYTGPQTLVWSPASSCSVTFDTPQNGTPGTQYVFTGWTDLANSSQPRLLTSPAAPATYTATFKTLYQLTTAVSPPGAGSATGAGFYDSGALAPIVATPNAGYQFVNWTGPVASASSTSTTVPMNAPVTATANFALITTTNVLPASGRIGDTVTLSASISASAAFTGTLQFKVAGVNTGAAIAVNGPSAYSVNYVITNAAGQYPISAVFTPTSPAIASSGANTLTVSAPITIASSVPGLSFTVTGTGCAPGSYTTPKTFALLAGTSCDVTFATLQSGAVGVRYAFTAWSANAVILGGTTVNPLHFDALFPAPLTYTANFKTQYFVTTAASPASWGSATGSGWYDSGSMAPITATATPAAKYLFTGWTGPVASAASAATTTLAMTAPASVVANFALITATKVFPASGKIGDTVTLKASVSASGGAFTGTLQFQVAGVNVGGPIMVNGTGSYSVSYIIANAIGPYPTSAVFTPGPGSAPSDGTNTLTVK